MKLKYLNIRPDIIKNSEGIMVIKQIIKKVLFLLIFTFFLFLYGWSNISCPVYFNDKYLNSELVLNAEQKNQIKKVFVMLDKQKINDCEIYKNNPEALYRVALQRRRMQDKLIEKSLNVKQKKRFKQLQKERDFHIKFFIINETLIPNKKQTYQIKNILEEYEKKAKIMMTLRESGKRNLGDVRERGISSRTTNDFRSRDGKTGYKPDIKDKNSPMDSLNPKMYKRIEPILTKNQKKLFNKVKKILQIKQEKNINRKTPK